MIRRDFLKAAGTSALGVALLGRVDRALATKDNILTYQGPDLNGWQVAIGDGLFAAEGEAPVSTADIVTEHWGAYSELKANTARRGIMAHNITYREEIAQTALMHIHHCTFSFRLPYLPSTGNWEQNAQTFEASFFIWDGSGTRADYGVALQWILNPWMSSFGEVRTWVNEGTTSQPVNSWKTIGELAVDTNWHTVTLIFDYQHQATAIMVDGIHHLSSFSVTPKDSSWSHQIVARLGAEIISIFPGSNSSAPIHQCQVRDWIWHWIPVTV